MGHIIVMNLIHFHIKISTVLLCEYAEGERIVHSITLQSCLLKLSTHFMSNVSSRMLSWRNCTETSGTKLNYHSCIGWRTLNVSS